MNYSEFVYSRFKSGARILGDLDGLTADKADDVMSRLHAAIGMVGEVRELRDATDNANAIEELGDLLFYAMAFANTLEIDLPDELWGTVAVDAPIGCVHIEVMDQAAHTLLDLCKKETLYLKAIAEADFTGPLVVFLTVLSNICTLHGTTLGDVGQMNREKLETRYPTGYSNDAAQARADKAGE